MRRTGKTLQWFAIVPVVIAAALLIGEIGDDDGGRRAESVGGPTTTTTVPFDAGGQADAAASDLSDLAEDVDLDTGPGLAGSSANNPPIVRTPPDGSFAEGDERVRVRDLSIDDLEARAGGDVGVLVVSPSAGIHMDVPPSVRQFSQPGSGWFPMIGSLDDINTALATMRLEPLRETGELRVTVVVSDFGHGNEDLTRLGRGSFSFYLT